MLGGNPINDRYGFRYWNNPGSFAELYRTGTPSLISHPNSPLSNSSPQAP